MNKIRTLAIGLMIGGVFVAGVAVGKQTRQARYVPRDEVQWKDLGGLRLGTVTGDPDRGPFSGLLMLPAGYESPWHIHSGDYEGIMISGTSRHWVRGEDGAKAKKLPPGSYWSIPGGVDHVSVCEKGADCLMYIMLKTKFDSALAKDPAESAEQRH